jgi:PAS domain S-box-containing protein
MLTPLLLLAFGSLHVAGDALRSQAESRLGNTAAVTAAFVAEHLGGFGEVLESYALRPSTNEALSAAAGANATDSLSASLEQLQQTLPGVDIAFASDLDGKLLATSPSADNLVGRSFSHRDWFRGAMASHRSHYISEIYVSAAAGHHRVIAVSVLVREKGPGSRPVGVLGLTYDTGYIREFTRQFAAAQGVGITITDQRGVVAAALEKVPEDLTSHASEPWVARALRGESGVGEIDSPEGRQLSAYAPVPGLGWTVACAVRTADAYAPLVRLRSTVLGIAFVLMLVLGAALSVFSRSFSQRQLAVQTLRESEARTARILEAATDAFLSVDNRGRITAWNRQAEVLFGWQRSDALGKDLVDLVLPERLREVMRTRIAQVLRQGAEPRLNRRAELHAVDRTGREFPVEIAVWSSRESGPPELHAFVHDISERRRAALELAAARDAANEASQLKSSFLANMSHEIRTPMNGIIGISEQVLRGELTASQRESVGLVLSSAESLLRVINDVLDFSKIEAGRLELDPAPFELRSFMRSALRPLALRAGEKHLSLYLEIGAEVPDVLVADFARIGQVLVNLIGNAIKFTERGRVVLQAALVSRAQSKAVVRFSVSDTGIGIPQEKHAAIFEAFNQADASTTRRFGGTGLGLTISARLVAMMGGDLRVASEPGQGSNFFFELPVGLGSRAEAAPARRPPARAPRRLRVLLAEDNPINRRVATFVLEEQGHEVIVAADGRAAVERFQAGGIELILMDVQMPELDGFEATAAIRRHEQATGGHVPIIGVTAHAMVGDRERCLAAGMDGYVPKPIRAEPLLDAIDEAQGRSVPPRVAAPAADGAVLDEAALLALLGGNRGLVRELAGIFDADSPGRLAELQEAAAQGNAARARRAAHGLKGSTGSLYGRVAASAAERIEQLAAGGDLDGLRAELPALEAALAELSRALNGLAGRAA